MGHLHCPYNVYLYEMVFFYYVLSLFHTPLYQEVYMYNFALVDLNLLVSTLTNLNNQTKETPKK